MKLAKAITGTNWNGHRFFGLKAVRNCISSRKRSAAPRLTSLLDIGMSPNPGSVRDCNALPFAPARNEGVRFGIFEQFG